MHGADRMATTARPTGPAPSSNRPGKAAFHRASRPMRERGRSGPTGRAGTWSINGAAALQPMLERNAPATEEARRVGEENIEALRAAGVFRIMAPRRFGGLETDTPHQDRGRARGGQGMRLQRVGHFTGMASAETQEEIWGGNPDARIAGVFNASSTSRKVDGGYIVLHADRAMLGIPVVDADGNAAGKSLAFMPMSGLTIEGTWFTAGMKGSGGNTTGAEDVFVPEHRLLSIPGVLGGGTATPTKDEALYCSGFVPVAALILVGPQLGLRSRTLEYVLEMAPKRRIAYTFHTCQTDSPSFQLNMAEAATLVDTAHLFAYRAADLIDDAAREGRLLTYLERARVRMDVGHTATMARDAIDVLMTSHGAPPFADFNPLQRIWPDCETASRHAVVGPDIAAEAYGRALVGIEEGVTPIV